MTDETTEPTTHKCPGCGEDHTEEMLGMAEAMVTLETGRTHFVNQDLFEIVPASVSLYIEKSVETELPQYITEFVRDGQGDAMEAVKSFAAGMFSLAFLLGASTSDTGVFPQVEEFRADPADVEAAKERIRNPPARADFGDIPDAVKNLLAEMGLDVEGVQVIRLGDEEAIQKMVAGNPPSHLRVITDEEDAPGNYL